MLRRVRCKVYRAAGREAQQLAENWQGERVHPPFHFCFEQRSGELVFEAWRDAAAEVHPQARLGVYQAELWRYDVVEFFLATQDASRYLEFNLSPNGAWWAAGFSAPRVPLPGFDAQKLAPAIRAEMKPERWRCSAAIPLRALAHYGWHLCESRLAACAVVCRDGQYSYFTSCGVRMGKPDFHRPGDWEEAWVEA